MSQNIEIRFSAKHAPTIKKFWNSDKFLRGILGPIGSGKSVGCVAEMVRRGVKQAPGPDGIRRTRWLVVRNTYKQLDDTAIKTVLDWLPPVHFGSGPNLGFNKSDHTYTITGIPGVVIEILFRALDRPDHVANVLSMELTGAWINEAREVPWAVVRAIQGRVGRYPSKRDGGATWFGVIMDTNPPDTDSEWYKTFEIVKPEDAELFRQPSGMSAEAENIPNLPDGYYERLERNNANNADFVKVYVHGEYGFLMDGRPVFPEYVDSLHCREVSTIPGIPVIRGWDYGLTPAVNFSQMTPGGQWIIVDELVSKDMGIDRFADIVLEHSAQNYPGRHFIDIGDPAGQQRAQTDEKTCYQILSSKGIDVTPGQQNLQIRLESMRKPMTRLIGGGLPGFVVHPRCVTIRKGLMGGYCFRRKQVSGEKYDDFPDKNHYSHVIDSCQYTSTYLFAEGLTTPMTQYYDEEDDFVLYSSGRSDVTGY